MASAMRPTGSKLVGSGFRDMMICTRVFSQNFENPVIRTTACGGEEPGGPMFGTLPHDFLSLPSQSTKVDFMADFDFEGLMGQRLIS